MTSARGFRAFQRGLLFSLSLSLSYNKSHNGSLFFSSASLFNNRVPGAAFLHNFLALQITYFVIEILDLREGRLLGKNACLNIDEIFEQREYLTEAKSLRVISDAKYSLSRCMYVCVCLSKAITLNRYEIIVFSGREMNFLPSSSVFCFLKR